MIKAGFYSSCDGGWKSYTNICFMNSPAGQFKTWDPCPNKTNFKCPANKHVLIFFICECVIKYCEICSKDSGCERCQLGYILFANQCIFDKCPLNYVLDNLTFKCVLTYNGQNKELIQLNSIDTTNCNICFDKNCQSCINENAYSCKVCKPNYFMEKGECLAKCSTKPDQFNSDRQCFNCEDTNCDQCNGLKMTDCQKCKYPTFLNKGECVTVCPKNQADYTKRVCFECYDLANCLSCESTQANACRICSSQTYNKDGVCVNSCGVGYYGKSSDKGVTKFCEKCLDTNCDSCKDEGSQSCEICNNSTFLDKGKCVTECFKNLKNFQKRECYDCSDSVNCIECSYDQQNYCTKCISTTKLEKGICTPFCSEGEFKLPNGKCQKCKDTNCKTCIDDKDSCIQCQQSYYLLDQKCVLQCPNDLFDSQKKCYKCDDSNCIKCPNSLQNTCTKCNDSTYLFQRNCVNECQKKKQYNKITKECYQCFDQTNCAYCTSSNQNDCEECNFGGVVKDGICVQVCGSGYFIDESVESQINPGLKQKKCTKCRDFKNCLECIDGSNSCTLCKSDFFLENGSCVEKCSKEKQFDTITKKCFDCYDKINCIDCTSPDQGKCEKCVQGMYLNKKEGICVGKCFQDQYDDTNNVCFECFDKDHCLKCQSPDENSCDKCTPDRVLKDKKKCVLESECGEGFYIGIDINNIKYCNPCFEGCIKCKDDKKSSCIKCDSHHYLDRGECVLKCENDQFDLQNNCYACLDHRCSFCSGTGPKDCKRCDKIYQNQGECVYACEENQYYDGDRVCFNCVDKFCNKCKDGKENSCMSCQSPKKLVDGYCKDKCDEKQYTIENVDGIMCKQCPKESENNLNKFQCKECFNINNCDKCDGNGSCLQCEQGWKLKNGQCVLDCGQSYFEVVNKNLTKCEQCFGGESCQKCSSAEEGKCTVCADGYYYYEGKCLQQCPKNHGIKKDQDNKVCIKCADKNCEQCSKIYTECEKCYQYFKINTNKQCIKDLDLSFSVSQNQGEENIFHIKFDRSIENLSESVNDLFDIKLNIDKGYEYDIKCKPVNDQEIIVQFNFTKSFAGKNKVDVYYNNKKLEYICDEPKKDLQITLNYNVPAGQLAAAKGMSQVNTVASSIAVNSIAPLAASGLFAYIAMVVDITEILQLMEFTQTMQTYYLFLKEHILNYFLYMWKFMAK